MNLTQDLYTLSTTTMSPIGVETAKTGNNKQGYRSNLCSKTGETREWKNYTRTETDHLQFAI